jgi:hypothetical protein
MIEGRARPEVIRECEKRGRGSAFMTRALAAMILAVALGACTTSRVTEPPQTATEQLLITAAIDDAVAKMKPGLPSDNAVYVDTTYLDTSDALLFPKYEISAVHDQLLRNGARLVADKKDADVVVELRTGGDSIDHNTVLVGIPPLPIPFTYGSSPEIALYKRDRQTGVAKLAVTVYSESTGRLVGSSGPQYGSSDHTRFSVLFYFTWVHSNIEPMDLQRRTN